VTVSDPSDWSGPNRAEPPTTADDDRLMARLAEVFRAVDPPPAIALELARESFTLRTLDAELAALVEDSDDALDDAMAQRRVVAVRGVGTAAEPRQLTFQFHDERKDQELVIAVQVEETGARRRLTGHLAPEGPARIEVRQPAPVRNRRVDVDHLGRFVIDDVPPGPTSLTCRRAGAHPVVTQWTLL
jgi:hypothetical protein